MLRILFLILVLMCPAVFAQTQESFEQKETAKAEKFDEFGNLTECDLRSRLDSFVLKVLNNKDARGYFIFYQGKNVFPAAYEINRMQKIVRNHISFRRFDPSRIVLVNGGFREEAATELWLVPNGADAPKPTNTIPKPKIPTDRTFLFDKSFLSSEFDYDLSDEFLLASVKARREAEERLAEEEYRRENPEVETEIETDEEEIEIEETSPEETEAAKFRWANAKFGELIKNRTDTRGTIIFYADDAVYDVGKLLNHVEEGKRKIAEAAKIAPDKIQTLFGGYRSSIEVEFFIIPKKGELPTAKPEARPIEEIEDEETQEVS
jgi:hypothetical protein